MRIAHHDKLLHYWVLYQPSGNLEELMSLSVHSLLILLLEHILSSPFEILMLPGEVLTCPQT
jgi:hypothetical protein